MKIDGHTRLAAVVATPIKHSMSPFIHNYAFDKLGINGVYVAWDIKEEDLEETINNIRRYDMWGINLSMPYKWVAATYMDELDASAAVFGMVNTVVNRDGRLIGYSTDGYGFFAALPKDFQPSGKTITMLGGSGTAMAIAAHAATQGIKHINIFNKAKYLDITREQQARLTEMTGLSASVYDLADQDLIQEKVLEADLLINASSIGMDRQSLPLAPHTRLKPDQLVADVIYQPFETPFLALAKSQGLRTVNGLGMLLHQAAGAFRLWTGQEMPTDAIWQELIKKYEE